MNSVQSVVPLMTGLRNRLVKCIMPNQKSYRMEDLSVAFLRTICAANGYSVGEINHDNDGLDIVVRCKGKPQDDCIRVSPSVDIQLKSSYSKITINADGSINYALEVKNYESLIDTARIEPLILVVFYMPVEEDQWIEQTPDWLKIRKCAYWISLKGRSRTDNTETITINLPSDHLLTKESLKDIMVKISKEIPL